MDKDAMITPELEAVDSSTTEVSEETQSQQGDNTDGEVTEDTGEQKPDAEVPFHEHPRFKELVQEKNTYKEAIDQLKHEIEGLKSAKTSTEKADVDMPSWWGGDSDSFLEYQGHLETLKGEAKKEAIAEMKQEQENNQKAMQEATDYMNSQIEEIKSEDTSAEVDKNKLLKYVVENNLIDKDNKWNYKLGYRMMKQEDELNSLKTTDNSQDRKKFASLGGVKADPSKPNIATPDTFKIERPW